MDSVLNTHAILNAHTSSHAQTHLGTHKIKETKNKREIEKESVLFVFLRCSEGLLQA